MNTDARARVSALDVLPCAAPAPLLALSLAALVAGGCVAIDGGAAELSWNLRTFEGEPVEDDAERRDCAAVGLEEVRLCWEVARGGRPLDQDCRADARVSFDCAERHGVTGFELAPGPTAFWIEPVCAGGVPADVDGYQVPAPIVRDVVEGGVVTLSTLLIVVTDPTTDPEALCAPATRRAPTGG